jgi:nitrite reductase (NADH) small subunit
MSHAHHSATWTAVCTLRDIVPNTGVCALVGKEQIAVFRVGPGEDDQVFAIANYDPNANAAVLSRGLVGNLGERIVVASPIYKHHFDLQTGECLEAPESSVAAYPARVYDGKVWVAA